MDPSPTDPAALLEFFRARLGRTVAAPLRIEVVELTAERIVLTMPITDAARQPYGLLHGGVSMVLAETAASLHACWGTDLARTVPVGVEINGSHLRSASEGRVRAVGEVLRRSRSLVVHEVKIVHEETGRLLCVARVTNFYRPVPPSPDGAAPPLSRSPSESPSA